jgi:dihydroorotate dehydrogenase
MIPIYKKVVRPLLFALSGNDAEQAHHLGLFALKVIGALPLRQLVSSYTKVINEREVFGIHFPNPVGLAAGFDKHAEALYGIEALGFGFVEIGTVTPLPQPGNPRPRMFRLEGDEALVNRMGFNNGGKEDLVKTLRSYRKLGIPLGINIGKGKDTPLEEALQDYEAAIKSVYPYADYLTINISSPNTKDLRRLHEKEKLEALLDAIVRTVKKEAKGEKPKPVLLKISPDLSKEEVDDILDVARSRVQGLIIHNTSVARPGHLTSPHAIEIGGLSGRPLTANALGLVAYVHRAAPSLPIIGVGGIFSADDAKKMLAAGASLVQLYTGFVYEGPALPSRINRALIGRS